MLNFYISSLGIGLLWGEENYITVRRYYEVAVVTHKISQAQ